MPTPEELLIGEGNVGFRVRRIVVFYGFIPRCATALRGALAFPSIKCCAGLAAGSRALEPRGRLENNKVQTNSK